jgi:hypothetical protein
MLEVFSNSDLGDESLASKSGFSNETLDLGGLLSLLSILGDPGTADDILLD